ncbi:unnamed protein product [Polarella glacialis]|uniref:Battenin n=1 Tax=Polarella glacialis TaxID=89957 RepID=A0A813H8J4_POLGL|nr:unnamed protein product [Polarella glacialis]
MTMSCLELARSTASFSDLADGADDEENVRLDSFPLAFAAVAICGTLNNMSYCMISGASQNLAAQFGMPDQMSLLSTAMNMSSLAGTLISTRFLLRFQFYRRVMLVLGMMTVSYLGVALSAMLPGALGFCMAAGFSCVAGMGQIFGETCNLAFLKAFPPELIGGWGGGTGLAGILGSLSYIVLTGTMGLSNSVVFALMAPLTILYFLAFRYLHQQAVRSLDGFRLDRAMGGTCTAPGGTGMEEELQPTGTAPATVANLKAAVAASSSILFNLVAVYCLEYFIYPGLDDRETLCAKKNWYTAMWLCYNIGVTISKCSVAFFRLRRVWLLTIFQLFNVIGSWRYTPVQSAILSQMNKACTSWQRGWSWLGSVEERPTRTACTSSTARKAFPMI